LQARFKVFKMKILFLCKYNRFRSKVAEAVFNKLNHNNHMSAESAAGQKSE